MRIVIIAYHGLDILLNNTTRDSSKNIWCC